MTRPLIVAHRGYSARYTENTLTAYRAAIAAGADVVESDARLSKDGTVWSCHDGTLSRLTGDERAVADLRDADLASVRLSGDERLVTLAQALSAVTPERMVLIDTKTEDVELIEAVVGEVARLNAVDRVWIGVRDAGQAHRARAMRPELSLLAFLPDYALAEEFLQAGATAFRVWEADLQLPSVSSLLKTRSVWVTAGGRKTGSSVGDASPGRLRGILECGPSAVLVNDPAELADMLSTVTDRAI